MILIVIEIYDKKLYRKVNAKSLGAAYEKINARSIYPRLQHQPLCR
jgi:hypothetical protein